MANLWTNEQLEAINQEGSNIIVSAGAGSGKTAVLSERVLRKINDGVHIHEILILTFTNAAAKEMKDRIRNKLIQAQKQEEIDLIEQSYITTFDSFSLSIVKKYHTLLNISKNIMITDSSILAIKKRELIDEVFTSYYDMDDSRFKKLIRDFCFKDDEELKKLIVKLNDKLDMKYDKDSYLTDYLEKYYSEEFIEEGISLYYRQIDVFIEKIRQIMVRLNHYLDFDYTIKLEDKLSRLLQAKTYEEVVTSLDFRLPNLPRGQESVVKELKEELSSYIKEIKALCVFDDTEKMKEEYFSTRENMQMILEIIKKFDQRLKEEKRKNNLFDFSDISRMAIEIVSTHEEIKKEISQSFQEIMIDEYQDTNDIQEYFISLISNNNIYMVGDIKQSIYRFRNANPYIFKRKYDTYNKKEEGIKIDLLKNFRSRKEVLDGINLLFDHLMDDEIGGADYKNSHQMVFGNQTYLEEGKTNQRYDLSILTYSKDLEFTNSEQEIFLIAEDIKEKLNKKYQIFDKDRKILRDVEYSDFVILIDRSTDFHQYKKIFEYLKIPLTLYQDEEIKENYDIFVIKNLLKLIICMDKEDYTTEFKYSFLSVGRSFLFRLSDDELFTYITKDTYKESILYQRLEEAYQYFYELSPKLFFIKLCEIFEYEKNLLTIGNIKTGLVRLEYFFNLLDSFSHQGKDIEDFIHYLDIIFEKEDKVSFSLNSNEANAVKIMTIHKSKGLEFPICYFSGFFREFSFKELNDSILYSNHYGIITPYFHEYVKPTFYKTLLKIENRKEELSEKIRLFYVALTRAKEKMIIVMPEVDDILEDKMKIKSFYDMMKCCYFKIEEYKEEKKPNCTKDYLMNKSKKSLEQFKTSNPIEIEEKFFVEEGLRKETFSKTNLKPTTEEKEKMRLGIQIHEILEFIDFKHPNYQDIEPFLASQVKKFIESDIIRKNLEAKFYKEYEFTYSLDGKKMHGVIDLMIEKEEEIIIIDYKLKKVDDTSYYRQLEGYRNVIKKRTDKKISTYLYSILDKELIEIKKQESFI